MTKKTAKKSPSDRVFKQCPNQKTPYLVGDFQTAKKRAISKARCKMWTCPYCSQLNKEQHFNRIANGLQSLSEQGIEFSFVTITCHENWRGQNASVKNWRKNKGKLLDRYRRKYRSRYGNACRYVYIPECHKDGTLHIHGVFSGVFDNRWWKDNARQCGLGYMAESTKLESVLQAVNYCLKYITKHIGLDIPIKNFRRINYSSGFPDTKKRASDGEWRLLDYSESIESAIIEGIVRKGFVVRFDGKDYTTFDDLIKPDEG